MWLSFLNNMELDLLTKSCHLQIYIPREFSHVLVTIIYMPPSANTKDAENVISSQMHDLETSAPDAFKIITGDFNHGSLKTSTISCFQHMKCSSQKDCILDQCYTNVQDAYTSVSLPPLRWSDHNLVHFILRYRPLVQRELTVTCTIKLKEWSADAVQNLTACAYWDVFVD